MSSVIVTQNGVAVTIKLSADHKAISFTTVDNAMSVVTGLQPGRYKLTETVTPEAYLTADAIYFDLLADGNVDCNGQVIVKGSPIVMVDKADPDYNSPAKRPSIPATGEQIALVTIIGVIVLLGAVCFAGFGVYRIRKNRE